MPHMLPFLAAVHSRTPLWLCACYWLGDPVYERKGAFVRTVLTQLEADEVALVHMLIEELQFDLYPVYDLL